MDIKGLKRIELVLTIAGAAFAVGKAIVGKKLEDANLTEKVAEALANNK